MAHERMHGSFYWNELMTRDVERDKKFYSGAIGWTFEPMPDGSYWVAKMGEDYVGGLFPLTDPKFNGVPEGWMSYLAVDDVDARVKKAQSLGATLMRPLFDVPGVGPHRHPERAWRRRHRLDHAGEGVRRDLCRIQSSHATNGSPRARRCSPRKRNSPRRAIN